MSIVHLRRGEDLTGQTFGALRVVRRLARPGRHVVYLCACGCGVMTDARADNLRSGRTTSCGCQRTAALVARSTRHPKPVAVPLPPPSQPRPTARMLPVYHETVAHRCERTAAHDERTRANAVARAWGVERRDDCTSYDDCLGRVPMVALDARCPRVCPGYVATVRRVEGYGGWRTTD